MSTQSNDLTTNISQRANWAGDTQKRRRRFRRLISASHHITFFLGKRFPSSIPLIFVLGYPKSGTSWVCQLVADYFRLPFPQHAIFPIGFPAVVHGHERVTDKYPRGVYVIRDGRDVMVSSYFHLRGELLASGNRGRHARNLSGLDWNAPASENMTRFIESQVGSPFGAHENWGRHVTAFFETKSHKLRLLRYEELVNDSTLALSKLVEQMTGQEVNRHQAAETVSRFSFASQSGRSAGDENTTSYLRQGKAGDWLNHFTEESATVFSRHFGKALIAAGYESSDEWVKMVQPRPVIKTHSPAKAIIES
jgi:hypothetical protein